MTKPARELRRTLSPRGVITNRGTLSEITRASAAMVEKKKTLKRNGRKGGTRRVGKKERRDKILKEREGEDKISQIISMRSNYV